MPNFFKSIFASEPPKASPRVDDPCEPCPLQERPEQVYKVVVTVTTRAGDIPVTGVVVNLDEALLGKTDEEGKSPESAVRTKPTTDIEVRYSNNSEGLNEEVFSLSVKEIVAAAKTFKAGDANHLIAKVQDVFGSGTSALGGDKDFSDTYAGTPDVSMTDTTNPDVKLLSVAPVGLRGTSTAPVMNGRPVSGRFELKTQSWTLVIRTVGADADAGRHIRTAIDGLCPGRIRALAYRAGWRHPQG